MGGTPEEDDSGPSGIRRSRREAGLGNKWELRSDSRDSGHTQWGRKTGRVDVPRPLAGKREEACPSPPCVLNFTSPAFFPRPESYR